MVGVGRFFDYEEEQKERTRNWQQDVAMAKAVLGDIEEYGTDDIDCVKVRSGISDGFEMERRLFSNEPVTLTRSKAMHSSESKWIRRPLPDEAQAEVVAAAVGALRMVAESSVPDTGNSLGFLMSERLCIDILYGDGTSVMFETSGPQPEAKLWIMNRLCEIHQSVSPIDRGTQEGMSHLSSVTYVSGGFLGGMSERITFERDESDGSCILTHEESRPDFSSERVTTVSESHEHVLSAGDWEELVAAVLKADLPNWADHYDNRLVCDGGWERLSVEFDDGWGLDIDGINLWDSRFAPILGFIADHDPDGAEWKGLADSLQRCEDMIADALEVIRRTPAGRSASIRLPDDNLSDYKFLDFVESVRLRALREGFLLCEESIRDRYDSGGGAIRVPTDPDSGIVLDGGENQEEDPSVSESIQMLRETLAGIRPMPSHSDFPRAYRAAVAIVRPIRGLTQSDGGRAIRSVDIHMLASSVTADIHYGASRDSPAQDRERLLAAVRGLDGIAWNDWQNVVRMAHDPFGASCFLYQGTRSSLDCIRKGHQWNMEIVWDDESVSFAHADFPPAGASELYGVIIEMMTHSAT